MLKPLGGAKELYARVTDISNGVKHGIVLARFDLSHDRECIMKWVKLLAFTQ